MGVEFVLNIELDFNTESAIDCGKIMSQWE